MVNSIEHHRENRIAKHGESHQHDVTTTAGDLFICPGAAVSKEAEADRRAVLPTDTPHTFISLDKDKAPVPLVVLPEEDHRAADDGEEPPYSN